MDSSKAGSGRFLLRIDPALHSALREAAEAAGMSLNRYCSIKLSAPLDLAAGAMVEPVVERATRTLGALPVGMAVFGSWARGETIEGSDVDLLVAAERSCELSRSLYRAWDREPLVWDGRPVEPHFVHLPERDHELIGLWAEVAVEGIVVFESGRRLSRCLAAIRRKIAEGKLRRREAHGQPYWTQVA